MTTIDKIRADIIRRITDNTFGAKLELMDILSFLDTIEEPVSDDMKEEVKRYYSENFSYITSDNPTLSILTNIARHFAEWGAEHLRDSTKKMSDDLEEAADEYSGDSNTGFIDMTSYRAFIAGAEWMKKQIPMPEDTVIFQKGVEEGRRLEREDMMEVAVETYYGYVNNTTRVFLPEKTLKGVKEGYNRIIILKDYEETK